ncbi:hypothetical protein ACA910_014681 [Epithemia clementina (nom. ined.)]
MADHDNNHEKVLAGANSGDAIILDTGSTNNQGTTTRATRTAKSTSTTTATISNRTIAVLPPDVVDRIAAGEVVQKPASAVKELLENALDAGAQEIRVLVEQQQQDGSWSKLTVTDNGCGMAKKDLPWAVVRHATSKLRSVADFAQLTSFGFRGEALASISMVARRLTLHSRIAKNKSGYILSFCDGKPVATTTTTMSAVSSHIHHNDGAVAATPQAKARNVGTTVIVEDLFYNLPHRKRAAASLRDEYLQVLQVVQKYAILYASQGVGFICEKKKITSSTKGGSRSGNKATTSSNNSSIMDFNTSCGMVLQLRKVLSLQRQEEGGGPGAEHPLVLEELKRRATQEVIALVYGSALKSHLEPFACHWKKNDTSWKEDEKWTSSLERRNNEIQNETYAAYWHSNNAKEDADTALPPTTLAHNNDGDQSSAATMECWGFVSHPWAMSNSNNNNKTSTNHNTMLPATTTTASTKTKRNTVLVLFVNQRLVESRYLQRRLEEVYAAFYHKQQQPPQQQADSSSSLHHHYHRPFLFLSLTVPCSTVDVNVHPTKREVTLLYLEEICQHLVNSLRQTLSKFGHAFEPANHVATTSTTPSTAAKTTVNKTRSTGGRVETTSHGDTKETRKRKRHSKEEEDQSDSNSVGQEEEEEDDDESYNKEEVDEPPKQDVVSQTRRRRYQDSQDTSSSSQQSSKKQSLALEASSMSQQQQSISKLIRTHHRVMQAGALEPFLTASQTKQSLVATQSLSQDSNNGTQSTDARAVSPAAPTASSTLSQGQLHKPTCPLGQSLQVNSMSSDVGGEGAVDLAQPSGRGGVVNLSQPGAFAIAASFCNCRVPTTTLTVTNVERTAATICLPRQSIPRPRKLSPTKCSFSSIQSLRTSVQRSADRTVEAQLRTACFVGVTSPQRSLLQIGEQLVLWNHYEAARELFYQLALNRFAAPPAALLGGGGGHGGREDNHHGIDVRAVIADLLQVEEVLQRQRPEQQSRYSSSFSADADVVIDETHHKDGDDPIKTISPSWDYHALLDPNDHSLKINDTNAAIADQAATCLLHHADMLDEYFSIRIQEISDSRCEEPKCGVDKENTTSSTTNSTTRIVLTALPVLLDNYVPCLHGLPLFLLRLATEVDWTEEKPCFRGICRELGSFYAAMPSTTEQGGGNLLPHHYHHHHHHVRHVLFPAISTLLVPSDRLVKRGFFKSLTTLTKLYRIFERC